MNYKYVAIARDNSLVQGIIEASNDTYVEERLLRDGLKLVSARPHVEGGILRGMFPQQSAVTRRELIIFSQQMAILLNAGTPLLTALQLLRDQAEGQGYKAIMESLIIDLRAGITLHGGMEKFPGSFPQMYVRLVEAGERSGTLEQMLQHLASYLQTEAAAAQKAKKALTYPAIVVVVGAVVMGLMVTLVLPAMANMLMKLNTELPLITRIVISVSEAVQAYKIPGFLALLVLGLVGTWYCRGPQGRFELGRLILTAPMVGKIAVRRNVSRFSRAMSLLLGAGLPVPDSLLLAKDASSNPFFRAAIAGVREQIIQGRNLAQALRDIPFMPGLYVQMVKAGEEGGVLEGNLASMAELYERDVDEQLSTMTSFLEPGLTVLMGVAVGLMALAVLMPMFNLMNTMRPS